MDATAISGSEGRLGFVQKGVAALTTPLGLFSSIYENQSKFQWNKWVWFLSVRLREAIVLSSQDHSGASL